MKRHLVTRANGSLEAEVPVCQGCFNSLREGVSLAELASRKRASLASGVGREAPRTMSSAAAPAYPGTAAPTLGLPPPPVAPVDGTNVAVVRGFDDLMKSVAVDALTCDLCGGLVADGQRTADTNICVECIRSKG